jgi:hypothetical protein
MRKDSDAIVTFTHPRWPGGGGQRPIEPFLRDERADYTFGAKTERRFGGLLTSYYCFDAALEHGHKRWLASRETGVIFGVMRVRYPTHAHYSIAMCNNNEFFLRLNRTDLSRTALRPTFNLH